MNFLPALLLLVTLTDPVTTLVLRTGETIVVDGNLREEKGRVLFRGTTGLLYSLPFDEIDLDATLAPRREEAPAVKQPAAEPKRRLRVSETERKRLIEELQRNHAGVPAAPIDVAAIPPAKSKAEAKEDAIDEQSWRRQARTHEEAIRRANENLQLIRSRIDRLRGEISGLLSLGYKPKDFTYQTTRLQYALEEIPYAELEVERANRAYAEFREDARKAGVTPGWLR